VTRPNLEQCVAPIPRACAGASLTVPSLRTTLRWVGRTVLAFVCFAGCSPQPIPDISSANRIEPQCPAGESGTRYFEEGSLATSPVLDASLSRQWGELLRESSSAPLWCGEGPIEAYRFLWIPTYGQALVVSAIRGGNGWSVEGIEYSKQDPREIEGWKIARRTEAKISTEAMTPVLAALTRGDFWARPFFADSGASDGASETLEGRMEMRYRTVTRRNVRDADLDEAVRIMISLAKLPLPELLRRAG
jgi:hypothetical protein